MSLPPLPAALREVTGEGGQEGEREARSWLRPPSGGRQAAALKHFTAHAHRTKPLLQARQELAQGFEKGPGGKRSRGEEDARCGSCLERVPQGGVVPVQREGGVDDAGAP